VVADQDGPVILDEQRAVLAQLSQLLPADYYLAGGVGVAAHLSHRASRDLDLFGESDPDDVLSAVRKLEGATVADRARGTLHLVVDQVPVTLLQYEAPLLAEPAVFADLPVPVASLLDLACMKLSAIGGRGAVRDFWDLHAIATGTGKTLAEFIGAFQHKFATVDVGHVVRSLVYFGDADAEPLPAGLTAERWAAMKRDFEAWVLALPM
jgi:hypothetical protein